MWTLLIAAVIWTATNMISGIKASSGRDFPSFKSPTGGQRPPMRSDVFITCNVFAIASRFIYYAARPMSWAHAHHVHTMPPNVGYAALSTGIPSTNDNELKKCPAFMMLDMLIIVALSAIGYNHYWQPTFILAVIACAMRCIYYVRTRKSATYITGTSEYAQAWAAQVGNISRFFSLWYHHPLWLAQFLASAAAAYVSGRHSGTYVRTTAGGGGICTPYGGGATKFSATSAGAGNIFVSGGKVSGPQMIMSRQVTAEPNVPGLFTYLILLLFVIPVVMTSVAASLMFSGMAIVASMASFGADFLMFLFRAMLQPASTITCARNCFHALRFGHIVKSSSINTTAGTDIWVFPASVFRYFVLYALLLAVEAGDDPEYRSSARMPRFDGQRTSYRTWLLAFSAYVSLRYPDLVGILDGTRDPPVPEAEQADRDSFLRHNRQVYGAIAQCVPEWLVNTLYMSCPNDGRSALVHLRTEYGVCTAMDRAAAMARLHRCYLDPRAAIDVNHVRYQYDSMREANNDLQQAGGQRLPDAASGFVIIHTGSGSVHFGSRQHSL